MQHNRRMNDNDSAQDENPIGQAAALAVLAGLITTLGDGLATVAAALALQESQQQNQQASNGNNSPDLQGINQQLNYLTQEIKKIKKRLNM